jgi:hypothetical protein
MRRNIALLAAAACLGLVVAAHAQRPSPATAATQFDGTYAFVSATKLTETYVDENGRIGRCPDPGQGLPLTVADGQARYGRLTGTVGPNGELEIRFSLPAVNSMAGVTYEVRTTGRIDSSGTVRARRSSYFCSYDVVWRKVSK